MYIKFVNHLLHKAVYIYIYTVYIRIESIKTTFMEDVSTRVLEKKNISHVTVSNPLV